MRVPLRQRSLGELIGLCFSVSAGNFGLLFLLAFVLNLPTTVISSLEGMITDETGAFVLVVAILAFLAMLLVQPLLQAATIRIVAGSFTGEGASLGESLQVAVRKILPLLGYGIVTGLITGLGYLLCIVPGLVFLTWYYLGPSALGIEDLGVGRAMGRSKSLSEGRRWEILGYAMITMVLFQVISGALGGALGVFVDPRLAPWIGLPFYSLLSIPLLVAPVVFYFNLRVIREGYDLEQLTTLIQDIGEGSAGRSRR